MPELAPKRNSELYEKYSIKGYPSFYDAVWHIKEIGGKCD